MSAERDALAALVDAIPPHLCCEDFDHRKRERHEAGEPCVPFDRYITALNQARAILRKGAA